MGIFKVRVVRGGQVINVVNWNLITFQNNNITDDIAFSRSYNTPTNVIVDTFMSDFNSNNGKGYVASFPHNSVRLFGQPGWTSNSAWIAYYAPVGIINMIEVNSAIAGDRYVFNNGNYIEVTAYNGASIELKYCLADGTIAFNNVSVYASSSNTSYQTSVLPWWNGNTNHIRLVDMKLTGHTYSGTLTFEISTISNTPYNESAAVEFFTGIKPMDPDNPYDPGGTSDVGPEDPGNFSEDSDDVDVDEIPAISAIGTGMATIFSPSITQLKALSNVFWGSQWWSALQNTIEGIDKMFVSLGIVPFSVTKGSTVEVTWLGLSITEVYLTLAAHQFFEFDMGSIDLSNDNRIYTSGSVFDYSPFSRLGIYLPFIGFQDLDIDECRGKIISLKYRIDILSGTCVAIVKIGANALYQFTGNCITQIPITSQNFENLFTNAVNVGIALGTARNAAAVSSAGEAVSSELQSAGKLTEGGAKLDAAQRAAKVSHANGSLGNATANAMMGMKPDFNKTGSVSASASLLTIRQPYLYLKTPRQCVPEHYQRYCGFPSNITGKLSDFSGYTVVEDIRLNGLVATSGEVEEIYELLKSGVIV